MTGKSRRVLRVNEHRLLAGTPAVHGDVQVRHQGENALHVAGHLADLQWPRHARIKDRSLGGKEGDVTARARPRAKSGGTFDPPSDVRHDEPPLSFSAAVSCGP